MTASFAFDPDLASKFAPGGRLRAAINLGNAVLAAREPGTNRAQGITVDLAQALADQLGKPLELCLFDTAAASVAAVARADADVGFFAVDPGRATDVAFTDPYLLIEGCYAVPTGSAVGANGDVDRPGLRVVVGRGSAYDLFLSRELRQAEIVRAPSSAAVVDTLLAQGLDVAAGVRQQLEADAARLGGLRLLDGRFMVIRQAMGLPRERGGAAASALAAFVEDMKRNGFIAEALVRHGVDGVSLAPPAAAS